MDTFIYLIFSLAVYIQICEGLYGCNESIPTISYVESCPKNKTEWNIAARRKNCDSLAGLQKCTEPENFQYHCLENQWQTMTLEICAPIFYLQGYCARYSTDKKRVEENYDDGFECLKFNESEKCPTRYPSTDAYKYQRCYKLKYQKPTQTACPICTSPSPSSQSETAPEDLRNDTDDSIKTAFLVILALALAGVIVFIILFYKRKSLNLERFFKVLTCDDVEAGSDDGTGNEKSIQPEEQMNEDDESSRLLINGTGRDEGDKRATATSDKNPARKDSTSLESTSGNNPFEENTQPLGFAVVSNSSSNAVPVIGIAPASATISNDVTHSLSTEVPSSIPRVNGDPKKLNSNKDIVSNISDNVPTSGQTSDIVTASIQKPVDDASLKPKPGNETASTKKSNTFLNPTSNSDTKGIMKAKSDDHSLSKPKPTDVSLQHVKSDAKNTSKPSKPENEPTEISMPENNKTEDKSQDANEKKFKENPPKSVDGHSLKPVSNENVASKSTSLEASDSQQVSNDKSAAVPVSGSLTSSSGVSSLKITKEDMKEVVIDDSKEIPTDIPAELPQSSLFHSSSLSKKNTSGSNAPDKSVSSSDQISQNGTDVSKPILQYQAAANSTPKDVPTSDDASVSTLSTDNPAPCNDRSSIPMSENNPFEEDTTVSDLSNGNPAPDSCASKPMSAINPFDEDSTPSATSEKDPVPNDSTYLKPISGNNPFEEDTPPSDAGSNIASNDNNASNQNSGSNPFDEDITLSEFGKRKPPRPPPHITKIDVPRIAPLKAGSLKKREAPPPPRLPGKPRKS